jgi:hypothetical protein
LEQFRTEPWRDFEKLVKAAKSATRELATRGRQADGVCSPVESQDQKHGEAKSRGTGTKTVQLQQKPEGILGEIYQALNKGYFVAMFPNVSEVFLENIKEYINCRCKEKRDELNRCMDKGGTVNLEGIFYETLAELKRGVINTVSISSTFEGAALHLSPNAIKNIIRNNFKERTDCELAEAFIINRLNVDPVFKECLPHYDVSSVEELAINAFDIGKSQYTRLKRIGANLSYLEELQGDIDLSAPGFLEKLYFLDKAFKNHKNDYFLIVRYLNHLTAKQFREFARNSSYDNETGPIVKRVYDKALLLYREYELLKKQYDFVSFISLQSEDHVEWLKKILDCAEIGEEHFKQFYPGIPWIDFRKTEDAEKIITKIA